MSWEDKQRLDGVINSHRQQERDAIGGAMGGHAVKREAYNVDEAMCYAGQFLRDINPDVILIIVAKVSVVPIGQPYPFSTAWLRNTQWNTSCSRARSLLARKI